jgi:hypothetical protein
MASQQLQYRIGDIAQRKVTTQDPPRSRLVLLSFFSSVPQFLKESFTHGRKLTGMGTGRTVAAGLSVLCMAYK